MIHSKHGLMLQSSLHPFLKTLHPLQLILILVQPLFFCWFNLIKSLCKIGEKEYKSFLFWFVIVKVRRQLYIVVGFCGVVGFFHMFKETQLFLNSCFITREYCKTMVLIFCLFKVNKKFLQKSSKYLVKKSRRNNSL